MIQKTHDTKSEQTKGDTQQQNHSNLQQVSTMLYSTGGAILHTCSVFAGCFQSRRWSGGRIRKRTSTVAVYVPSAAVM